MMYILAWAERDEYTDKWIDEWDTFDDKDQAMEQYDELRTDEKIDVVSLCVCVESTDYQCVKIEGDKV